MKNESADFTDATLTQFIDAFIERERAFLADRLEDDAARLAALVAGMADMAPGDDAGEEWTAHEILAHIAVFSRFHGMLSYKIGTGQLHEVDLLGSVQQRDAAGAQMATHTTSELLEIIQTSHRRTVAYLRAADAAAMQRRAEAGGGLSVSVEQIVRLIRCAHLEQHIDQLASRHRS